MLLKTTLAAALATVALTSTALAWDPAYTSRDRELAAVGRSASTSAVATNDAPSAAPAGDKEAAKARFAEVVPQIDRMATKGILRKHRAAHYKSQLNAKLRAMP